MDVLRRGMYLYVYLASMCIVSDLGTSYSYQHAQRTDDEDRSRLPVGPESGSNVRYICMYVCAHGYRENERMRWIMMRTFRLPVRSIATGHGQDGIRTRIGVDEFGHEHEHGGRLSRYVYGGICSCSEDACERESWTGREYDVYVYILYDSARCNCGVARHGMGVAGREGG